MKIIRIIKDTIQDLLNTSPLALRHGFHMTRQAIRTSKSRKPV